MYPNFLLELNNTNEYSYMNTEDINVPIIATSKE